MAYHSTDLDALFQSLADPTRRAILQRLTQGPATVTDLARRVRVSMPICEAVRHVLHEGGDLRDTFARVWSSPLTSEPHAMGLSFDHPSAMPLVGAPDPD